MQGEGDDVVGEEEEEQEEEEGAEEEEDEARAWVVSRLSHIRDLKQRIGGLRQRQRALFEENALIRRQLSELEAGRQAKRARLGRFLLEVVHMADEVIKGAPLPPFHVRLRPRNPRVAAPVRSASAVASDQLQASARLVVSDAQGTPLTASQSEGVLGELSRQELPLERSDGPNWTATVANCKFLEVSSLWGGSFQIHAELVCPSPLDATEVSLAPPHSIRVVTRPRKYAKTPSECLLDDPLATVKGIGPTYAKKLEEMGYTTVEDVLRFPLPIPNNPESQQAFQQHMGQLRKPRGKTASEFEALLRQLRSRARALRDQG